MAKKILLVEDDLFILDIYKQKFIQKGFAVEVATDGEMALDKARQILPDILLLDILLPKMDGWEVLKNVRQDPLFKDLKVVMISNLNIQDYQNQMKEFNVSKYFIKAETTPEELANTIKELLK
ncbi:response regulator [Candidatus Parcubacteria bacterium]|nr:response regulator [Candidatus Parcubacteria bacterium]